MSHPSQTRRCALVKAVTFTASVVWSALPWTLRRACGSNLLENHKPSSANCDIMPVVLSVCENGGPPSTLGILENARRGSMMELPFLFDPTMPAWKDTQ